jgi:tetratricopeptide (TPR) repeat protein
VDAKSVVSIEGSYRNFAKAVRLPGWDEKDTHILASVRDWLDTDGNGPWVMIMDSADDTSVLTAPVGPSAQHDQDIDTSLLPQVREYLPISRNGAMLVTSTNSTAAQLITGNFSHHIEMEEMCENESLALLKSKLHPKVIYTEEQAKNLVKAAEYMPLAVSQTAACISLEYPRLTLVQATEKLNNPGADAVSLLEESIHEPNRDVRRTNSVVKSWHLSFQYVRQTSPSAARLLSLMCLFDRQGIPEALLSGHYNEKPATVLTPPEPHPTWWTRIRRPRRKNRGVYSNKSVTKTKASDFHADWYILNGLMLVKTNVDGCHFNMHRLVQCTTQRWLELNGELETWTNKYVLLMNIVFPEIEYDHFDVCQYLFPHAQQVANYRPTNPFILKLWAPLIQKISRYAYLRGGFACAENLGRMALATFEALVGERHECTLRSLHQLAEVLNRTKSYPEAETLFRRAWEGKQATLGPDDPDTLESMKRLGEVLGSQNKTQEAWQTALHVIEGYERFYGPTHSQTQGKLVLTAFGFILNEQFEQAANIQRRLYGIHREIYGDDSDKTYETMGALAGLLTLTGNASEAEALLRPVVAAFEGRYGLHRLLTIQSINRLGEALTSQGKLEETAALYQCVLDVYSDLDEKAREAALNSADNYAQVLCKQSHLGGAEEMGRWMVGQRELLLGTDHLDTLVGVHTLAGIMAAQEKPQEAVTLFERAYHGTEKIAGPDHSDTVEFLEDFNHAKRKVESDMPRS